MGVRRTAGVPRARVAVLALVIGALVGAVGLPLTPASAEAPVVDQMVEPVTKATLEPSVEPDAPAVEHADPPTTAITDPWLELPAGPPHLIGAVMATDPVRGQTIVSGGLLDNDPMFIWNTDTWVWNGSSWANLGNAGLTTANQRVYGAMVGYDQATGRILRFGGYYQVQGGNRSLSKDTYSWNGSAWARETGWDGVTEQPPARVQAAMATDPETGHVVMFGGLKQNIPGYDSSGFVPLSDTWTWDGAQWRKVVTASGPNLWPGYRMTSNPAQDDILMFGNDQDLVGRTYRFDGATWTEQFTPPEHSIYNRSSFGMATATGASNGAVPVMFGGVQLPRSTAPKDCGAGAGFGVLIGSSCGGAGVGPGDPGSPTYPATEYVWDTTNNWWVASGELDGRSQYNPLTATDPLTGHLLAAGPLVGETPGATLRVAELTFAGPNPVQVVAGQEHTCALAANGTVSCRGGTSVLQADPGNLVREHGSPATVAGPVLTGITKVSAGDLFTCALQGGTGKVFCWGSNQGGQLGPDANNVTLPDTDGFASRYAFQIPGVTATDLAAGGWSACATVAAGVMCWGANFAGQLGRGTTSPIEPSPALVQGSAGFTTPSIGISHACARSGGAVRCWGANDAGQLGNGTTTPSSTPVVVSTISTATALVTTQYSSCALVGGGLVKCWGGNDAGQLGIGTTVDGLAPGAAVTGVSGATAIAGGAGHVCALGSGAVRCWGLNGRYQLGNGSTAPSTTPVVPVGSWGSISQIAAGFETTCIVAVRQVCWGEQLVGISAVTPGFSSVSSSATGPAAVLDLSIPPGTLGAPLTGASVNTWRFDGVISGGVFDGLEQWTFVSNQVLAFSDPLVVGGLTAGREYRFEVALATLGTWGAASAQSPRLKVVTVPGPAPTFTAVAGDRSATLSRSGAPSDGGSPVTVYRVTPYIGGVAQAPQIRGAGFTELFVTGLQPGATYTFRIAAGNAIGFGPEYTTNAVTVLGPPAPGNDAFAEAIEVSGASGTVLGSNVGAGTEPGEPVDPTFQNGASVWYSFTAPFDGPLTIDTCGSSFDTVLGVYTGPAVNSLAQVGLSDDDGCGTQSTVSFSAVAGTTYRIAVGGFLSATGNVVLNWSTTPSSPPNDAFAAAQALSGSSGTLSGDNIGGTVESGEAAEVAGYGGGASIWYSFTPAGTGDLTVDTCGTAFDTLLGVYTGTAVDALASVGEDDNSCGDGSTPASSVTVPVVGGTTYRVRVDGWDQYVDDPLQGPVTVNWSFVPGPAVNDPFAGAEEVSGTEGSAPATSAYATKEPGEPTPTGNIGGSSVWFSYLAPATGSFVVDTCASDFDTLLGVYTGESVDALTLVGANDNVAGCGAGAGVGSSVTFAMQYGVRYWFEVDGYNGATGSFWLYWRFNPMNDYWLAPQLITGKSGALQATTLAGSKDPGEPTPTGAVGGHSIWYQWAAPATGPATFDTCNSLFDTVLGVYTGAAVDALTMVAEDDDGCDQGSRVSFNAVAGTTYWIQVDGKDGATGEVAFHWGQAPANDNMGNSVLLSGTSGTAAGTNVEATEQAGEPRFQAEVANGSVWYRYVPASSGWLELDTCGSDFDTMLAVHTGSSVSALTQLAVNDDDLRAVCGIDSRVVVAVTAGTTYRIQVGGFYGLTGAITLHWQFMVLPGAPTIGTAFRTYDLVNVAFTAPVSNGGGAILSYTASCVSGNGGVPGSASGTVSPIVVAGLTIGKNYTCTVTATNAAGTGPASAASNSVIPRTFPSAPLGLTAVAGVGSATLSWTAPASNGGAAITGYTVTPFIGLSSQTPVTFASSATSQTVTGLTNGQAYWFTVAAINVIGTGPASSASNTVTPATVPGAPTIGTPVGGNASVSVAFTAPASNGGAAISSYTASCTSADGGVPGSQAGAGSPIVVSGLTNGKGYTCSVTATSVAGTGPASAASNQVTPLLALVVPGATGVSEGNSGTTVVQVPVSLSNAAAVPITVSYTTIDYAQAGVAASGADYVATSGTVTFAAGETAKTVPVTVKGDVIDEPDGVYGEWILVAFSNPTAGAVVDSTFLGLGVGVIIDDDPPPTVTPGAAGVTEGNSGTTVVNVPLTLSNPSAVPITVSWTTMDYAQAGVAVSGLDYVAASGTVTFAPGETAKTVSITVKGDTLVEPSVAYGEWILVAFSNATGGATIDLSFLGLGVGVIVDDD